MLVRKMLLLMCCCPKPRPAAVCIRVLLLHALTSPLHDLLDMNAPANVTVEYSAYVLHSMLHLRVTDHRRALSRYHA